MKKSFLSLTLLYSLHLIPSAAEPAPEPTVQDVEIVTALEYIEQSDILPYIATVLYELKNLPEADKAKIVVALVMAGERGTLNKGNIVEKTAKIIERMTFNAVHKQVSDEFYEPIPTKIGNSFASNIRVDMRKNGIRESVIAPYTGHTLEYNVYSAMQHDVYATYRRF